MADVALRIAIPTGSPATAKNRRPDFVSSGTNGLVVNVYTDPQSQNQTAIASIVVDLSAASSACTTSGSLRSCVASLPAPPGTDDFVATTYDTAPVNGQIPASAKVLGTATITKTIIINSTNSLGFAIGGQIATIALSGGTSYSFDKPATLPLQVSAMDAAMQTIVAGSQTATNDGQSESDTYANPITLSVSPSTHASLSLNGATGATSVMVTKSSDSVSLVYDGAGYASPATLVVSAAASGVGSVQTSFVPLVLTAASASVVTAKGSTAVSLIAVNQSATLTASGGSGTYTFAATNAGTSACPTGAVSSSTTATTVTVTADSAASDCVFEASDGVVSDEIDVAVTVTGSTIVVPTKTLISLEGGFVSGPATQTTYALPSGSVVSTLQLEAFVPPSGADVTTDTGGVTRDANGMTYATVQTSSISQTGQQQIGDALQAYAPQASGSAVPIQMQALSGNGTPHNVAVDRSGKIYMVLPTNDGFAIYPAGLTGSARTTVSGSNTRLRDAEGIAVDAAGYVYVLQAQVEGGNAYFAGEIDVFAPPNAGTQNVAPVRVITLGPVQAFGDDQLISIALDTAGDIFVAQYGASLLRFSVGNTTNTPDMTFPIEASALAVDSSTGLLYASSTQGSNPIMVFDANDPTKAPTTLVSSQSNPATQLTL